jgi:hypothetical protein
VTASVVSPARSPGRRAGFDDEGTCQLYTEQLLFAVQYILYVVQLEVTVPPHTKDPARPARRERPPRHRWWWAGLAVIAIIGLAQDPGSLVRTLGGSLLPVLAGCAWVLASSDWPA